VADKKTFPNCNSNAGCNLHLLRPNVPEVTADGMTMAAHVEQAPEPQDKVAGRLERKHVTASSSDD
jgi:hypothetical protein